MLCLAVASSVGFAMLAPTANADELTAQRDRLAAKIAQTRVDLSESSSALTTAAVAVERAQGQLAFARARLAKTRRDLRVARRKDKAMAAKLQQAQLDLAAAKAAVTRGQRRLDAENAMAGDMVRDQYQQQTNLLPIAILVESSSTADLQTRLQWSTTMFDTAQAQLDRLKILQGSLSSERARQAEAEKQVAADRQVAADNLVTKRNLERTAMAQKLEVAALVRQRSAAQRAAAVQVAADQSQYAGLNQERASVEHRIAVRIAKAKAERARQIAAARAARAAAHRAAVIRAVAAAHARQVARARANRISAHHNRPQARRHVTHRTKAHTARRGTHHHFSGGGSTGHGFSFPVSAPITSPYGMRFHPVLHIWKLHDGTDFGAGCGAAIHAPHSGRVAERYFNRGYGNRLMIDHGFIDGRFVTTGYNHAIGYTVGVGEHVRKGEVIGYVGTTGFSTGCHLHLMVWLDGHKVNPMSWF